VTVLVWALAVVYTGLVNLVADGAAVQRTAGDVVEAGRMGCAHCRPVMLVATLMLVGLSSWRAIEQQLFGVCFCFAAGNFAGDCRPRGGRLDTGRPVPRIPAA